LKLDASGSRGCPDRCAAQSNIFDLVKTGFRRRLRQESKTMFFAAMKRDRSKLDKMVKAVGINQSSAARILNKNNKHGGCSSIDGQTLLSELLRQWMPYPPPPPAGKKPSSLLGEEEEDDDDDRTTTTVATEVSTTNSHCSSSDGKKKGRNRGGLLYWFSKK
jgi:hypothetical protein